MCALGKIVHRKKTTGSLVATVGIGTCLNMKGISQLKSAILSKKALHFYAKISSLPRSYFRNFSVTVWTETQIAAKS